MSYKKIFFSTPIPIFEKLNASLFVDNNHSSQDVLNWFFFFIFFILGIRYRNYDMAFFISHPVLDLGPCISVLELTALGPIYTVNLV